MNAMLDPVEDDFYVSIPSLITRKVPLRSGADGPSATLCKSRPDTE